MAETTRNMIGSIILRKFLMLYNAILTGNEGRQALAVGYSDRL
jgi:hypothetical protein